MIRAGLAVVGAKRRKVTPRRGGGRTPELQWRWAWVKGGDTHYASQAMSSFLFAAAIAMASMCASRSSPDMLAGLEIDRPVDQSK